ncbi:hypothetical protein BKA69DRAFT_288144 [Paraphysoderma sedebokerense]|nr:hypothetical protein BKA69DRAFT_288144 [Paraphysoderma sedebokerense]
MVTCNDGKAEIAVFPFCTAEKFTFQLGSVQYSVAYLCPESDSSHTVHDSTTQHLSLQSDHSHDIQTSIGVSKVNSVSNHFGSNSVENDIPQSTSFQSNIDYQTPIAFNDTNDNQHDLSLNLGLQNTTQNLIPPSNSHYDHLTAMGVNNANNSSNHSCSVQYNGTQNLPVNGILIGLDLYSQFMANPLAAISDNNSTASSSSVTNPATPFFNGGLS